MLLIIIWPLPRQCVVWGLARPVFQKISVGSTICEEAILWFKSDYDLHGKDTFLYKTNYAYWRR
jgi:hypothetical protein